VEQVVDGDVARTQHAAVALAGQAIARVGRLRDAVRKPRYISEDQISAKPRFSVTRSTGSEHWQQGRTEPLPRTSVKYHPT
jgi:hypothetical protein